MKHIYEKTEKDSELTETSLCRGSQKQIGITLTSAMTSDESCSLCQHIEKHGRSDLPKKLEPFTDEFDVRLIFVRDLGRLHYSGKQYDTSSFLSLPSPVKNLTRNQLLLHLEGLEKSIRLLKSYVQGHRKAYEEEIEPELKEKKEKEVAVKDSRRKEPTTIEGMLEKVGMTKEQFVAKLLEKAKEMKNQGGKEGV